MRASVVFEKMILSVLAACGVSVVLFFSTTLVVALAEGAGLLHALSSAFLGAMGFGATFFLAGFIACAAILVPLSRALEKAEIRGAAPYAAASVLITLVILFMLGRAPGFHAAWRFAYLAPGVGAALMFGRLMAPYWRIVDRAAKEEETGTVFRFPER